MDHAQLVGYAEKRIEDCDDTGTRLAKDKAHEEYLREHVRPGRSSRSIFQEAMDVGTLRHDTLPPHGRRGKQEYQYRRSDRFEDREEFRELKICEHGVG
nr:hypothetical protein B0A51_14236 [Rachicladosporium sp. CCFEE 5018]